MTTNVISDLIIISKSKVDILKLFLLFYFLFVYIGIK